MKLLPLLDLGNLNAVHWTTNGPYLSRLMKFLFWYINSSTRIVLL